MERSKPIALTKKLEAATLVETIVALLIIVLVITFTLRLFASAQSRTYSIKRFKAQHWMQQITEEFRIHPEKITPTLQTEEFTATIKTEKNAPTQVHITVADEQDQVYAETTILLP